MMNLVETKVLVAVLLMLTRFLSGVLPIKVYSFLLNWGEDGSSEEVIAKRHQAAECLIARIQSFGGGVLFATCFLHMIPEVRKSMKKLLTYSYGENKIPENLDEPAFPYSELIVSVGFFMVYFIEEFTHWCVHNVHRENRTTPLVDENISSNNIVKFIEVNEDRISAYRSNNSRSIHDSLPDSVNHNDNESTSSCDSSSDEVIIKSAIRTKQKSDGQITGFGTKPQSAISESKLTNVEIKSTMKEQQKNIRGFLVVLAISVHSIFEGLSIGLQKSISNIWYMFTAISIHASTILYCIGFEMAVEGVKTVTIVIHMIVLAVVSPFGIVIGLLFTLKTDVDTKGRTLAVCILEGISAGTVLYITFFEVLHREKNRRHHRISRSLCILAGFGLMIALQFIDA